MARKLAGRLILRGDLVAQTAVHVGGYGEDVDTDLPLARNGKNQWYIPGTSLAGPMRAWCETIFGAAKTQYIWGYQAGEEGTASFVLIEDAPIEEMENGLAEIRDHVGIDRHWGTAAPMIKYDRAVLPRGTRIPLKITVDFQENQGKDVVEMFAALAQTLQQGEIRLGAAKTRGLGNFRLENATLTEHVLNTPEGILALLRDEEGTPVSPPSGGLPLASRLDITISWKPDGPLMVGVGIEGMEVDHLPLVSGVEPGKLTFVLPGSSIKGALRNQAERIVLTLLPSLHLSKDPNPRSRFLTHMEQVPLMEVLFGAAGKAQKQASFPLSPPTGEAATSLHDCLGLGALIVDDCYAQIRFTQEQWRAVTQAKVEATVESASDAQQIAIRQALQQVGLPHATVAFHVAVDRWTGGAAESLLFTVLEPHAIPWDPIRLTVDVTRLRRIYGLDENGMGSADEGNLLPAVMCLLLVLRDMACGRVPLGFAVHRGMGAIRVEKITFRGRRLPRACQALENLELPGGDLGGLPPELRTELNTRWQQWITTQRLFLEKEASGE